MKRSLIVAGAAAAVLSRRGSRRGVRRNRERGRAGSEKGATYEVEVRKADGTTVDVRLDAHYGLVAVDSDSEQADTGE